MQGEKFFCLWRKIGVYPRLLLALGFFVSFGAKGSFAASAPFTQPTYTEQNNKRWSEGQDAGAIFSNTELITSEASEEHGTNSLAKNTHAGIGGASALKRGRKALLLPVLFDKKSPFASFLLFTTLLGIWLGSGVFYQREAKIISEPAKGKGIAEDDFRKPAEALKEGPTERLTKIKALLPAAKRLASAVNTEESAKLLTAVQKTLRKADLATSAADSQKLGRALTKALGALRKLHEVAVYKGNEIVQTDEYVLPIHPLASSEGERYAILTSLKDGILGPTVNSFVSAYEAVYNSFGALYDRYTYAHGRLFEGHRFEDEEDGELLLEAALLLEQLRSLSAERQHSSAHALELKEGIIVGVKLCFIMEFEDSVLSLETDLSWLRIYAVLLREAAEESKNSNAPIPPASEKKPDLHAVEEHIRQLESLLAQMNAELETARRDETLEVVIEVGRRMDAWKKEANELLQKYPKGNAFSELPHSLSLTASKMLFAMAEKTYQTAKAMNDTVRRATRDVKDSCANFLSKPENVGEDTARLLASFSRLLETASNDARKGDACVKEASALQKQIRQSGRSAPVMREARKAIALVRNQKDTMAAALSGMLQFFHLGILEEHIQHIESETSLAALQISHLTEYEEQNYKKALKELNLAEKAAREAKTPMEAAKAVGEMRSSASALKDIVYRYGSKKD